MTKLKAIRLKKGWSQMLVCEGVNQIGALRRAKGRIDPSVLSKYESGARQARVEILQDFCKFYKCTMEEVIGESDE